MDPRRQISSKAEGTVIPAALAVFGLAAVEIWFAVPAGLALGLAPWLVWIITIAGSLCGVIVVAVGGDRLRTWLTRRRRGWMVARAGRTYQIWVRFGVPGWGLASPLLVAPAMGTAIGLLLGAPRGRLLAWMGAGVVIWTSILVVAGMIGVQLVQHAVATSPGDGDRSALGAVRVLTPAGSIWLELEPCVIADSDHAPSCDLKVRSSSSPERTTHRRSRS